MFHFFVRTVPLFNVHTIKCSRTKGCGAAPDRAKSCARAQEVMRPAKRARASSPGTGFYLRPSVSRKTKTPVSRQTQKSPKFGFEDLDRDPGYKRQHRIRSLGNTNSSAMEYAKVSQINASNGKRQAEEELQPGVCKQENPIPPKKRKIVPLGTTCVLVGPKDIEVPESERDSLGLHVVVEPGFKTRPFVQAYRMHNDNDKLFPNALIDFSTVELDCNFFRMYFESTAARDYVLRMWRGRYMRERLVEILPWIAHMAKLRQ